MKELFKKRMLTNTVFLLVAIFLLVIAGCEQEQSDIIMQSLQNVTPVADDFIVSGLTVMEDGGPKAVRIWPRTGKSQGTITVYYEGVNGNDYPKDAFAPSAVGKYAVTFDVAAADGFNAANGLRAGTLTINFRITYGNGNYDDGLDDDYYEEDDDEEDDGDIEIINEPLNLVDFEDVAWIGAGAGSYKNRKVTFNGHDWSVSGMTVMNTSDHYTGSRGIRFRGSDSDGDNANRLELLSFLKDGIESISFDYASYGTHKNGKIELYYQKEGENNWVNAGDVTAPAWATVKDMRNAVFFINEKGNIRFKIEKVTEKGSTTVNVDNIVINTY